MGSVAVADLEIVYADVADLRPDPGNARIHPKRQIDQLVASIRSFGFVNPILIDEAGGVIAGHGRLIAARKAGLGSVPTITLRDLSDLEKRALRLADNKLALGAVWDADLLSVELEALSIPGLGFDISLTGFSAPEIDIALSRRRGKVEDVPARPPDEVTVSEVGDVWILGGHRIACGDCRDPALMGRLMAGAQADAAFLDPPYNIPISGFAVGRGRHPEFACATGEMSPAEFVVFLEQTLGAACEATRPGGVHFVAMDWRHMTELLDAGRTVYDTLLNLCVWNKSNGGMGSLYRSKHELIFVYRHGPGPHYNAVELGRHGRNRCNVWDYSSVNSPGGARRHELDMHPTVKPTQMVADALIDVTRPGDVVLDVFLGSGTTLVAAEQIGRACHGVELDPRYVDVALERWARLTCREPVLERSGQTFAEVRLNPISELFS